MQSGHVARLQVAPASGEPMEARSDVEAVADEGIRSDRYFDDAGLWNELDADPDREESGASDITLIEMEAIEAVEREAGIAIPPGAHRRNVTTRGVPVNHLVGHTFHVGEATCAGTQLCEPCSYMQSLVGEEGLAEALVHRGGLDARIVESGRVSVDDRIRWESP